MGQGPSDEAALPMAGVVQAETEERECQIPRRNEIQWFAREDAKGSLSAFLGAGRFDEESVAMQTSNELKLLVRKGMRIRCNHKGRTESGRVLKVQEKGCIVKVRGKTWHVMWKGVRLD